MLRKPSVVLFIWVPLLDNNLDCRILTIDNKSVRKWGRVWGERDAPRLEFVEDDIVFFFSF